MANDKKEIQSLAEGMGANPIEVLTILGIAFAESNYDFGAKGDHRSDGSFYSHGAFQAERQAGVSHQQQVKTALDRIRQQLGYLKPIFGEFKEYIDNSDSMTMRYMKTNWQIGVTQSKNWMNAVREEINNIKYQTSVDDTGVRIALTGEDRKLNVNDFIAWLEGKGVNGNALRGGQDLIGRYIDQEMPSITVAGATGWGMGLAIVIGIALFWFLKR